MKSLKDLLKNKKPEKVSVSDKDIFYIFRNVLREEYGNVGASKIKPNFLKDRKLFLCSESSSWAAEVFSNRSFILKKINEKVGQDAVKEIRFN